MAISNLGVCYEAIQRTYRNSVVEHVRSRMKTAFPADYIPKVQAPFSKEWGKISASAAERRQTGELAAEVKDDFDVLGVNHFFNLFEAYFDDLCPAVPALTPEQRKLEKQALLQWTKVIKNLRDPLSPNRISPLRMRSYYWIAPAECCLNSVWKMPQAK